MSIARNGSEAFDNNPSTEFPNLEKNKGRLKKVLEHHPDGIYFNNFNHRPSSNLSFLLNDHPSQLFPNEIGPFPNSEQKPGSFIGNGDQHNIHSYGSYSPEYHHHHVSYTTNPTSPTHYRNLSTDIYSVPDPHLNYNTFQTLNGGSIPLHFAPFALPPLPLTSSHSQYSSSYPPSYLNLSHEQNSHSILNSSLPNSNQEVDPNYRTRSGSILDYLDAAARDELNLQKRANSEEDSGFYYQSFVPRSIKEFHQNHQLLLNSSNQVGADSSLLGSLEPNVPLKPNVKLACNACIRGHRAPSCKHFDRTLFIVRPRGRPSALCHKCLEKSTSCRCQLSKYPTSFYSDGNKCNLRTISSKLSGKLIPSAIPTPNQNNQSIQLIEKAQNEHFLPNNEAVTVRASFVNKSASNDNAQKTNKEP